MDDFNEILDRALRDALRREAEAFPVDSAAVWRRVQAKLYAPRSVRSHN